MLINGSFEQGLSPWAWTTGTPTSDTTHIKYGTQSLHTVGVKGGQSVNLLAGHTYLAQCWVMCDGNIMGASGAAPQGAGIYFLLRLVL